VHGLSISRLPIHEGVRGSVLGLRRVVGEELSDLNRGLFFCGTSHRTPPSGLSSRHLFSAELGVFKRVPLPTRFGIPHQIHFYPFPTVISVAGFKVKLSDSRVLGEYFGHKGFTLSCHVQKFPLRTQKYLSREKEDLTLFLAGVGMGSYPLFRDRR
jgi:hypothetical protein